MAAPVNAASSSDSSTPGVKDFTVDLTGVGTISAGDLLIVQVARYFDVLTTSDTGWTKQAQISGFSNNGRSHIFEKVAAGGETVLNITGDGTQNDKKETHIVIRVTGQHASSYWYQSSGTVDQIGTNPDPPSLDPGVGSDDFLWFAVMSCDGRASHSASPTNYALVKAVTGGGFNNCSLAIADRTLTASSEDPGTFTISGNRAWAAITIAIRPAAAGGGIVLEADGVGVGGGSATLRLEQRMQAAGAGVGAGSATLRFDQRLTAAGAGVGAGAATLRFELRLEADGAGIGAGTADLTVTGGTNLKALGDGIGEGSALLRFEQRITAAGGGLGTGSALLRFLQHFTAPGHGIGAGSALLRLIQQLEADGAGLGTGLANLTVQFTPGDVLYPTALCSRATGTRLLTRDTATELRARATTTTLETRP